MENLIELFQIQPINNSTKPARFMTLNEYNESIVPIVKEIRAILRKKTIFHNRFPDSFFTADQFLAMYQQNAMDRIEKYQVTDQKHIDELLEDSRHQALKKLNTQKINLDEAPDEATLTRFRELLGILTTSYLCDTNYLELNKAVKSNSNIVRDAMDAKYIKDLLNGELTIEELEFIAESVKVRVPKRIYEYTSVSVKEEYRVMNKASKLFYDAMELALEPHKQSLCAKKKIEIEKLLAKYPVEEGSEFPKECIGHVSAESCRILSRFCKTNFESALKQICLEYYERLVLTFIYRIELKLNVVNANHDVESIVFSDTTFHSGILETKSTIKYKDGLEIYNESSLIYAEGEIQSAHFRYITNFWCNGKKQNQKQLDSL
ncbi:hypothetical protein [Photobacterium damselae]|uniref:hypothetical protein n=1 Tax=Photobacterium damselae TaxID=38293 RepID=UPI0040687E74